MYFKFEIFVKDIRNSIDFYANVLGLPITDERKYAATFKFENTTLLVSEGQILSDSHYFDPASLSGKKGVGCEMILQVDDIRSFYHKIVASNYPVFEELEKRPWGLTDFRLIDPDGYYIRITN